MKKSGSFLQGSLLPKMRWPLHGVPGLTDPGDAPMNAIAMPRRVKPALSRRNTVTADTLDHHLVAGRVRHDIWRNRIGNRAGPGRTDVIEPIDIHADPVNLRIGCKCPDHRGDVVTTSLAVDDVGEKECLAIFFGHAAAKLPPPQRGHLGVFVCRGVDLKEQAFLFETKKVLVQVGILTIGRDIH